MVKIIDCFIFYNEIELLKARLEELYNIVDYFVIVEGTLTFTGNKKTMYFNSNINLFHKYKDKIIYVEVDDFPLTNNPWIREYHQRNSISRGIEKLNLNNDDIIIISDSDEIPSNNLITMIKNNKINIENNMLYSIEMKLYYYTLEWTADRKWYHPKIINYFTYLIKPFPEDIRFSRINYSSTIIRNGGWHISYYGDINFIINKLNSFSEQQENTLKNTDPIYLQECINNGILYFNNNKLTYIKLDNNNDLPSYYLKNKKDNKNTIPKVAFTYWEGNELTYLQYYTIYSFNKYNPDYEIIIYTCNDITNFKHPSNTNIQNDKCINLNKFLEINNVKIIQIDILKKLNIPYDISSPIFKADIVRIIKLYEHGGIWIDLDILFIKPIPDNLINNIVDIYYFSYSGTVATGLLISSPKNKGIKFIYDSCLERLNNKLQNKDLYQNTNLFNNDLQFFGPSLWRDCIFKNKDIFGQCELLDTNCVYPYMPQQMNLFFYSDQDYVKDNTICIHWYNGDSVSRNYIKQFDPNNIENKCVFEKYLNGILN